MEAPVGRYNMIFLDILIFFRCTAHSENAKFPISNTQDLGVYLNYMSLLEYHKRVILQQI